MGVETRLFEIAPTPLHRAELLCLHYSPWFPVYLDWGTYCRMLWLPLCSHPIVFCLLIFLEKRQPEGGKYSGLVMTFGEGGIRLRPQNGVFG